VSYGYATHHIIWRPNANRQITLPSGAMITALSATLEYVPMEFFEARTGELRFLGLSMGYTGTPLAPGEWMVTAGEFALMKAASISYYFKRLATHDLVNLSEKFGTPGIVVHTTAAQGSPQGKAALQLARSLAGNYRGVQYGASENKNEIIWPTGGASATNLPMHVIREDTKRELSTLYLGADLSTMSRGGSGKSVGASVQEEEQEKRAMRDCLRLSETLDALSEMVLRYYLGEDCEILARVEITSPNTEDRALLLNIVTQAVAMGAKVPIMPIAERFNLPIAKEGEEVFTAPSTPGTPAPDNPAARTRNRIRRRMTGRMRSEQSSRIISNSARGISLERRWKAI